jgi:K+-transporting ATPase KdpF subunit
MISLQVWPAFLGPPNTIFRNFNIEEDIMVGTLLIISVVFLLGIYLVYSILYPEKF